MAITSPIAQSAISELPLTWKALRDNTEAVGETFLDGQVRLVTTRLFGNTIDDSVQAALDPIVLDYAGKLVALTLINPGIDYWSKQNLSVVATGRNETKSYGDRAADLRVLAARLLEATRLMWPEVQALLPGRRFRTAGSIPRVRDVQGSAAITPNPYDFERPFAEGT